jgi:hypothetical protein
MSTDNSRTFDGNKYPDSSSPDYELAASFIAEMAMGSAIHLSSFDPDDKSKAAYRVFRPRDDHSHNAFIRESVKNRCNTFYCANVGNPNVNTPPKKESITHLRALVIDIDPLTAISPEARKLERLRIKSLIHDIINGPLPPTWVVDTGNGAQLVYQFTGPIALTTDDLKAVARDTQRTIAHLYHADMTTATLEHLFRIPGTGNYPPEPKRAKGALEGFSGLWLRNGKRWDLQDLYAAAKHAANIAGTGPDDAAYKFEDLPNCEKDLIDMAFDAKLDRNFFEGIRYAVRDLREDNKSFDSVFKRLNDINFDRSDMDLSFCCFLLDKKGQAPCDVAYALAAYGAHKAHPAKQRRWYNYLASTVLKAQAKLKEQSTKWYDNTGDDEEPTTNERKPNGKWARFADVAQAPLGVNALVRNLFGRQGLSMLYGPSNAGKSLAAMSICSSIASHQPIAGHRVNAHDGCVIYVVMEGSGGLSTRVRAMQAQFPDRYTDGLVFITGEYELRSDNKDKSGSKLLLDVINDIAAELQRQPVFIVIDMLLIAANGANENSSEDMGKVFQNLAKLAEITHSHVMVLHHTGKNEARGARGWSGMRGRIDTELELASDAPTIGRIVVTKQRDMEIIHQPLLFNIVSHHVATDPEGHQITGAVAVFEETAYQAPNESERMILDVMMDIGRKATLEEIITALRENESNIKPASIKTALVRMHRKRLIGYTPGKPGGIPPAYYFCWTYNEEPNDPFN